MLLAAAKLPPERISCLPAAPSIVPLSPAQGVGPPPLRLLFLGRW